MGVITHWENSRQTAIVLRFCAPWTWAGFEDASAQLAAMVQGAAHRVDVLIHMAEAGDLPDDALFRMGEWYAADLPNLGQYVLIGAPDGFDGLMAVADRYYTAMGGALAYATVEAG